MIPESIAIIPDGNRRLAKRLMKEPWKGHELGLKNLYNVLDWSAGLGIKHVTVYALSLENIQRRPKQELDFLFYLMEKEMDSIIEGKSHLIHKRKVQVSFFGQLGLLPKTLQKKLSQVQKITKTYKKHTASFALAYGGRQEILEASRKFNGSEQSFRKSLQTKGSPDPDLIIRTGGEKRLSNFLPFQSVYSELAFTDTFWPELSRKEFNSIIHDFSIRQRRFGK